MQRGIIQFDVDTFKITNRDNTIITSGNRNYIFARFHFSPHWNGLTKTVIFSQDKMTPIQIILENDICQIPNVFMIDPGIINVSVFGGDRLVTDTTTIQVKQGGYQEGIPPLPPEPTYSYIQSQIGIRNVSKIEYDDIRNVFEGFVQNNWIEFGSGGGGGGSSDIAWLPYVDDDSNISWERSNTLIAPETRNIRGLPGRDGESFDPTDVKRITALETLTGELNEDLIIAEQNIIDLQGETTAKWVLLNDVDNRTRTNTENIIILQDTIGTLNEELQERLDGVL